MRWFFDKIKTMRVERIVHLPGNETELKGEDMEKYYLAIDIGASSGRHILAHMENGKMVLEEIYRFPNGMVEKDGENVWDVDASLKRSKTA